MQLWEHRNTLSLSVTAYIAIACIELLPAVHGRIVEDPRVTHKSHACGGINTPGHEPPSTIADGMPRDEHQTLDSCGLSRYGMYSYVVYIDGLDSYGNIRTCLVS